jgi:hypothetical protein
MLGGAIAAGLSFLLPAGPALIGAACASLLALARPLPKEDRDGPCRPQANDQPGTEPIQ